MVSYYSSLFLLVPDLNLGFFVACNNNVSELLTNLSEEIFKRYYPIAMTQQIEKTSVMTSVNSTTNVMSQPMLHLTSRIV
jgi:hypothetical protein